MLTTLGLTFGFKIYKTLKMYFHYGLIHKKIERGRFMSFEHIKEVTEINSNELTLILNGGQIPLSKSGKKISLKS